MTSRFINIGLVSSPLNWATILVWVLVMGFLLHMLDPYLRGFYPQPTENKT